MRVDEPFYDRGPLWFKDAVIYELHIRAFNDKNGDGSGDLQGLTEKLDYLERLGITALWLLPFFPSPMRDDGYDIADYMNINPDYGTMRDFKQFLNAAHERKMQVIIELVLNHTSFEHRWFQRARTAKPGSNARNYYVWSDSPEKYKDARIIFQDFETSNWTWDAAANAYYWHRFYSHQPDLNYENPNVQKAMLRVIDFWFSMGVDGLRLDAVPYLYESEGTNCENLPQTHAFLKRLRTHVDEKFPNRLLLAEANQWPEDAVAYFGTGDECHMAFHFPVMPRLFMSVQMEDSYPIVDIMGTTPSIPDTCQWAMFLRNHDELTLEMVTDEERDYMNRSYAQDPRMKINVGIRRRLAPLLGNNRKKIELMNILLFSFPGTPVIYYGDELGMGDNYYLGDRDGVRTPMQWNSDRNAGFSRANPHKLYLPVIIESQYHYEAVNVETQEENLSSMLWWMRRVIAVRKRFKAFSRGGFKIISSNNSKVFSCLRSYLDEKILIIANLSRFTQVVSLSLDDFSGYIPEEIFSRNKFPMIRSQTPYTVALTPYGHYWLILKKETKEIPMQQYELPHLNVGQKWDTLLKGKALEELEHTILPAYVKTCRWFGAKAKIIRRLTVSDTIRLKDENSLCIVCIIDIQYNDGKDESYFLPISFAAASDTARIKEEFPHTIIASVETDKEQGVLYDAISSKIVHNAMLDLVMAKKKYSGRQGYLIGTKGSGMKKILSNGSAHLASRLLHVEQSNSSICFEDKLFLKVYRRLEEGKNPEFEMMRFLSEKTLFSYIPPFAGVVEYNRENKVPITVGLFQGFVTSLSNAWEYTLDTAASFFEQIVSLENKDKISKVTIPSLFEQFNDESLPLIEEFIGGFFREMIALLGTRTGQMHCALASERIDPAFRTEPFSLLYQRSLFQSMQSLTRNMFAQLKKNSKRFPEDIHSDIEEVLGFEKDIIQYMEWLKQKKIETVKIRVHGDYHLGQVLFTGKDFIIMDFEGEPARSLSERKLKHSPFKDVAGMIRSFHYAGYGALLLKETYRIEDIKELEPWIELWFYNMSTLFLESYTEAVRDASFVPADFNECRKLLFLFLLEKSIYELGYEMNNRPTWITIPLKGIKSLMHSIKGVF